MNDLVSIVLPVYNGDKYLKESINYGSGIRILNQDLWEMIISYIISANNNIPRIKGIIERLSKTYGKEIEWNGEKYYTFPTLEELKEAGLDSHYAEHAKALFPTDSNGVPFTTTYFATTGDPLADIAEDMAAEQKARAVYENLIDLTDDPNVIGPLLWLRQREIVHYARFKELFEYYDKKIKNGNNYINEPQKTNMNYNYNNDYLLYKLHTDNNSFF